jgi:hypothetical protein
MIIKIDRDTKIRLLQAMKDGYMDTANIPVLDEIVAVREPARILTRKEARELLQELEKEY